MLLATLPQYDFLARANDLNALPIENVLIVGVGWVGSQVAARFASCGVQVWLCDRTDELTRVAQERIKSLEGSEDWIARVHAAPQISELETGTSGWDASTIDLVLENVPEQLSTKKRLLKQVSRAFPAPTLIASNSSYFVPSLLSKFVDTPSRFAHIHFHVPVLEDSVADIVGCEQTAPEVLERLRQLAIQVRQSPLMLRREHPGYIFNWMLQSMLKSALELAVLDVADPADIDKSWKAVTGMELGPFGMMDQIGLDVIEQVLSNARWAEPPHVSSEQLLTLLREKTNQGQLGVKSGAGFYPYDH